MFQGVTHERILEWSNRPGGFDTCRFILLGVGEALFGDETLHSTNTVEALEAASESLKGGLPYPLQDWLRLVQARALEDLVALDPDSFFDAWVTTAPVSEVDGAVSIAKVYEALQKREDLDLRWIPSRFGEI